MKKPTQKFTPAPWRAAYNEGRCYVSSLHNGARVVAEVLTLNDGKHPEDMANAQLIASSPDLLSALKAVVAIADRKTKEFEAAHAAIERAELCL